MLEDKNPPVIEGGAVGLAPGGPVDTKAEDQEIVTALSSYWNEADQNRKSGLNPRDMKWEDNLNLYWNRYDFSKKAAWQAKETMPEVPAYVDRFAAALKQALVASPDGFYSVIDPADQEGDLAVSIKRMLDVWLSRVGRGQMGQLLPFSAVFEEQMKLGALMALSSVVTWKKDIPGGRVAIEPVDPRFVWLDHTYRNLYRIRRTEVDRQELNSMMSVKDSNGDPLFREDGMASLVNSLQLLDQTYKQQLSGHGNMTITSRQPITLDEYIATVISSTGEVIADRALMVVANNQHLIRGPEKNPFWHGADWLVYSPMMPTPLSVYGRTYMEDFGSVAKTYTELTNMILDAVHTVSLKAFVMAPSMLLNPEQANEGIGPNKLFLIEEGVKASDFAQALEMGTLPPESFKVWETMKRQLTEAAGINEIGMGQFAPKGRTSATEVESTQNNSSALVTSIAGTIETRWLDPTLDLAWKTGLQHTSANDVLLKAAVGDEMFSALIGRRKELIRRPFTFQARGISNTIKRANTLKSLMGLMQVIGSNPLLLQEFMKEVSMPKLTKMLFDLSDVPFDKLSMSDREKQISAVTQQAQQAQQNAGPPNGQAGAEGKKQVGDVARTMGIGQ